MSKKIIIKAVVLVTVAFFVFLYSYAKLLDNKNFKIVFNYLDNRSDNTIVNAGNGEVALFDCGDRNAFGEVCSALSGNHFYNVDYVFITTTDEEHIGYLNELIKIYDIKEVFICENNSSDKSIELAYKSAREKNVKIHYLKNNEAVKIGEILVNTLLVPTGENEEKVCSIFRVEYKDLSCMLLGSISGFSQKYLLEKYPEFFSDTDIVRIPHTYNEDLTYPPLLDAISPTYAVYSTDYFNTLSQNYFKSCNIKLYPIKNSSVIVTYKNNKITVNAGD